LSPHPAVYNTRRGAVTAQSRADTRDDRHGITLRTFSTCVSPPSLPSSSRRFALCVRVSLTSGIDLRPMSAASSSLFQRFSDRKNAICSSASKYLANLEGTRACDAHEQVTVRPAHSRAAEIAAEPAGACGVYPGAWGHVCAHGRSCGARFAPAAFRPGTRLGAGPRTRVSCSSSGGAASSGPAPLIVACGEGVQSDESVNPFVLL
jgi:hypothetical protein